MRNHLFRSATYAALLAATVACGTDNNAEFIESAISLTTELGGSAEGYERACEPRDFVFPKDHGAHPEFRNEWWYVTGNLSSNKGKRFGFHATFFRIAVQPATDQFSATDQLSASELSMKELSMKEQWQSSSEWAASQFYMGHFAISEEGAKATNAHERFARAAAGLAGATAEPVNIWLDDWQLTGPTEAVSDQTAATLATQSRTDARQWELAVASDSESVKLALSSLKPPVLQGDRGLSFKSDGDCNASYYYSISRLQVSGKVVNDNVLHPVTGTAWIDREWSSSVLAGHQVGWDWFALQLTDGRDLMIYQLRDRDGRPDAHSYAVEIDSTGNKTIIPFQQIRLDIERWWESPSGARYPVSGRIHRTDTDETIVYRPLIDNQELPLTVRYWEGAILLSDDTGASIGHGYLELTGY